MYDVLADVAYRFVEIKIKFWFDLYIMFKRVRHISDCTMTGWLSPREYFLYDEYNNNIIIKL